MSEITEVTEENKRKIFNNYTLSTCIVSYLGYILKITNSNFVFAQNLYRSIDSSEMVRNKV